MADEQKNELEIQAQEKEAEEAKLLRTGHRRLVRISPEGLLMLIKHGGRPATNELPFDTDIVSSGFDLERNAITLIVESQAFDLVADGEPIPMHPPITFRAV